MLCCRIRFGTIETLVKTESYVYSIVPDEFVAGNILFVDRCSLKTTDGKSVHLIVGDPNICGYVEGTGSSARFREISGAYQMNRTHVIVSDVGNHCLRLVQRETNRTAPFVGKCGKHGNKDGTDPLFSSPWSINVLSEDPPVLVVSDRGNNALRAVSLLFGNVSTIPLASQLKFPLFAMLDDSRNALFVSSRYQLNQINLFDYTVDNVTGDGTYGDSDGWFDRATFKDVRGIVKLSENVLIVADSSQSKLKVLDLQQKFVTSICAENDLDADGDIRVCRVFRPISLLVVDGFLYIGGNKMIKRVKGNDTFKSFGKS